VDEFLQAQQSMKAPGLDGWWTHARPVLSDEQWESLMGAARSRGISHRAISMVLDGWGVQVTPGQVGHWRRTYVR
jgi:kynureninase